MVLVLVMFGCLLGCEKGEVNLLLWMLNGIQKFFVVFWFGCDSFVCFLLFVLLCCMVDEYGIDKIIVQKLVCVVCMYFVCQWLVVVGLCLLVCQDLFNKLLVLKVIVCVVEDEVCSKKILYEKVQQNVIVLMEEIVVNFLYEMICLIDCIFGFIWNCLYQGINVYNVECVCQLVYDGYEIVYVFCYCSYMDYLLFFYVLYYQGLVFLYIVVGINFNFWLVGLIFCCFGVFFICCIFKGNKFYFIVFCEYFGELFSCGYFVEYFVEGGCFCIGCLFDLKIGMLLMIIQVMLCGGI